MINKYYMRGKGHTGPYLYGGQSRLSQSLVIKCEIIHALSPYTRPYIKVNI